MKEMLQSRKFVVTLLILALGSLFAWFGKLSPELVELFTWIGGLYLGFNVSQKASEWAVNKMGAKAAPAAPAEGAK